jgi:hypothetical protein
MADPRIGLFLPTTPLFDVGDLEDPVQSRELIIRLTQKLNDVIISLNLKDTGYYPLSTFVNGQSFFPNPALSATTSQLPTYRQVYRIVIDFGTLPVAATKSVAHGLMPTAAWTFTRIYATASDTTGLTYIPIPFASPTLANNIQLDVDAVNVNITTAIDYSTYTTCYVILEWITS